MCTSTDELTHTVISSSFQRGFDPQSGSVCQHSGCLCCEGGAGGNPLINMEPLKLLSSSFWRGIDPNSGSVYPNRCCEYCNGVEGETPKQRLFGLGRGGGGEGTNDKHGALKLFSKSFWRGIKKKVVQCATFQIPNSPLPAEKKNKYKFYVLIIHFIPVHCLLTLI